LTHHVLAEWMTESQPEIRFEELGEERPFASAELQARAKANRWQKGRKQFRVWLGESEAAYLSFDVFWGDQVNLYEVFVAAEFRTRGVGAECIRFAMKLTKELQKPRLTVKPGYIGGQSKDELRQWYIRRGFNPVKDEAELLEIIV
jgi:GNAT superfamily N-acetyltransferase